MGYKGLSFVKIDYPPPPPLPFQLSIAIVLIGPSFEEITKLKIEIATLNVENERLKVKLAKSSMDTNRARATNDVVQFLIDTKISVLSRTKKEEYFPYVHFMIWYQSMNGSLRFFLSCFQNISYIQRWLGQKCLISIIWLKVGCHLFLLIKWMDKSILRSLRLLFLGRYYN